MSLLNSLAEIIFSKKDGDLLKLFCKGPCVVHAYLSVSNNLTKAKLVGVLVARLFNENTAVFLLIFC
jgi:hypothetical protein